ncbi:MAG: hypothetical protein JWO21_885 [Solirubrobacterales bacterium]|nr:hypothetical protein [Solirubrobacterales bacterium]
MPSETYANIAPEAESGTLTANVLLWGSDGGADNRFLPHFATL